MHTAEEVRKEAEALDAGRIRERDAKQMLLAYADLLEAMTNAASDVLDERKRQIEVEGWSTEHDNAHDNGDLACAAASYALHAGCVLNPHDGVGFDGAPPMWPQSWSQDWWKPKNPRRDLVRAAALIIAEIERMDRAALAATRKEEGARMQIEKEKNA